MSPEPGAACAAIRFAGHALWLDASGVLYWPAQHLLVAADLHFEKASFLARAGHPLPPYDTRETLALLAAKIAEYQPRRLLLLGDSFHDSAGFARMAPTDRMALAALAASVEACIWIEGNHDATLPIEPGWVSAPHLEIGGLQFRHQPDPAQAVPQLVGHFHPKAAVRRRGHKISGRCFVVTGDLIVLPAFGAYAGGLDIASPAFRAVLRGRPPRVFLCRRDAIHEIDGFVESRSGLS